MVSIEKTKTKLFAYTPKWKGVVLWSHFKMFANFNGPGDLVSIWVRLSHLHIFHIRNYILVKLL